MGGHMIAFLSVSSKLLSNDSNLLQWYMEFIKSSIFVSIMNLFTFVFVCEHVVYMPFRIAVDVYNYSEYKQNSHFTAGQYCQTNEMSDYRNMKFVVLRCQTIGIVRLFTCQTISTPYQAIFVRLLRCQTIFVRLLTHQTIDISDYQYVTDHMLSQDHYF